MPTLTFAALFCLDSKQRTVAATSLCMLRAQRCLLRALRVVLARSGLSNERVDARVARLGCWWEQAWLVTPTLPSHLFKSISLHSTNNFSCPALAWQRMKMCIQNSCLTVSKEISAENMVACWCLVSQDKYTYMVLLASTFGVLVRGTGTHTCTRASGSISSMFRT
jgi:hypothetical protein